MGEKRGRIQEGTCRKESFMGRKRSLLATNKGMNIQGGRVSVKKKKKKKRRHVTHVQDNGGGTKKVTRERHDQTIRRMR